MNILVFDNYDSFTYNLVHALREITGDSRIDVVRNDKLKLEDATIYDKIILSPGPGIPSEAGLLIDMVKRYASSKSILGVCLGHQAIGEAFGAKLVNLKDVHHGLAENIHIIKDESIYKEIPETFVAGRYHSWVISPDNLPDCLEVTAVDDEGQIMSIRHKEHNVRGVQFHPESVLTPLGKKIIQNWLEIR